MNEKRCPACGMAVQGNMDSCPGCGLTGLNRHFLSRAGYEKWVQEVLEPHVAAMTPRVFAGNRYGLILTGGGELYGIGRNDCGQIEEQMDEDGWDRYSEPRLMATNVISAAAGNHYTIYVTRDGEVHLRGRGELAERFSGFSGAKAVYALSGSGYSQGGFRYRGKDVFWILNRAGELFAFGDSADLLEQEETVWQQLEEVSRTVQFGRFLEPYTYGFHVCAPESDMTRRKQEIRAELEQGEAWQKALARFGGNVELRLTQIDAQPEAATPHCREYGTDRIINGKVYWIDSGTVSDPGLTRGKAYYYFDRAERIRFLPEIIVSNKVLYEPVPCPRFQWMTQQKQWQGSRPEMPLSAEKQPAFRWKKAVCNHHGWLWLLEDGSVVQMQLERDGTLAPWDGEHPRGLTEPVTDLSMSENCAILICKNGEILWDWCSEYGDIYQNVTRGEMSVCRLPRET